jgi:hypothetical protein
MGPVKAVGEVFEAMQRAKTGGAAFCTNFFPVPGRLQGWIEHGELLGEWREGLALFLRRDRDFWHLYFCAANATALGSAMSEVPALKSKRVAVDLVGKDGTLGGMLDAAESAGFRRYSRLVRLARAGGPEQPGASAGEAEVARAEQSDVPAIVELLEGCFDRYADQLPTVYEIEAAVAARQILAVRWEGALAALLFFDTQGVTSTVRFWVVAERFRSKRFGGALIRHYFATHPNVRRFILWVTADNENAVEKYRHYGYGPDGLVDHVLVNSKIEK